MSGEAGQSGRVTRRAVLRAATAGAVGAALARGQGFTSRVVDVRSWDWLRRDGLVDAEVVKQMVDRGLMALLGESVPQNAWCALFGPGERVGLKFNQISRDYTGANQALVTALAGGLMSAGVKAANIIVVEAEGAVFDGGQFVPGWGRYAHFGSGRTQLSDFIVNQVDAIINVPNLKHHPIVGFTGCLKNMSHARETIMEGPQRFHDNNCDPYIADIFSLPPIRRKVRLNVLNGLKGIYANGAYPSPQQWAHNGLVIGLDPVAVDTVSLGFLVAERTRHKLPPLEREGTPPKYLATCAERGLGVAEPGLIEVVRVEV